MKIALRITKGLLFVFLSLTCFFFCSEETDPIDPQMNIKLVGCWKGGLVRNNVIVERDLELRQISLKPDSTIELSAIFEIGPRSRVWKYSIPITCQNNKISWLAHQGLLSENGDTMSVVKDWKGEKSDWRFVRERNFDHFMTKLMLSENPTYTYTVPAELADGWSSISIKHAGIDESKINRLVSRIKQGKYDDIHSLLICRYGKLTVEEYFALNGKLSGSFVNEVFRNKVHHLASVTKGILSALLGIAIDQELILNVDEPISKYLSEYKSSFNQKSNLIRIQDMLTMRSGWEWEQFKYDWNDKRNNASEMYKHEDVIKYVLERPMLHKPGKVFKYSNGVSTVLGKVLQNACGMGVHKYADQHLFQPLNIKEYLWSYYPDGSLEVDGGLALRARDLAKIGQLFIQNGMWNGRQLISEQWIQQSTIHRVSLTSNRGFGYYWNEMKYEINGFSTSAIFAPGDGGQFIAVLPALDLVIVITAGNYNIDPTLICWSLIENEILPAIKYGGKQN